ncbi:nucleotidyltransferase domain-containing protein [Bradyrhizobium diazoefficiens]|uniref:nucleotidyltransferase domain-containing protein n=1 Tax=Bradyrhizobium diazoefficiens TaxID=1355477 RepID=UPI002715344A|nr:nucleotidyltransferase domain-containing protein [Bradyrhizobium diazoefficiens]WLB38387.1 nucleotidyltransferase domain-containing protein [Bradyrhizobium diazoefficiens]
MRMPAHLESETDLLKRLTEYLEAMFGNDLLAVALIGSRANGYATQKSDVDLHVVLRDGAKKRQLGLRRQLILTAETHMLAVTESTLVKGALDVINQPMENVCLTLFAYKVILGSSKFDDISKGVREAEARATKQWLALQEIHGLANGDHLIAATILRKLMWAPPLVERWQRKVREVGLDRAWSDAAKNLRLEEEQPTTAHDPDPRIVRASPLLAIRNLMTLTSRHNNLSRDMKAAVNGVTYGPIFLALACYEAIQVKRGQLSVHEYLVDPPPAGIAKWIHDTEQLGGVARARRIRNQIKDYIV